MVELDHQGEIIWQDCYGGSNWELGLDIMQEDGGYTFFSHSRSNDYDVSGNHGYGETADYWLAHIDEMGVLEWQNCYGGSEGEGARQFYKTANNGYVLIGSSSSDDGDVSYHHGSWGGDVWVVVLDSNRNILWEHSYGGMNNNSPSRNSIAQRGEMDFVIGALTHEDEGYDSDIDCTPYPVEDEESIWLFRIYDPTLGAYTNAYEYHTLSAYPNPTAEQVFLELPNHSKHLNIQILDVFGKQITSLKASPQQTQIIWDCSNIAAGIYFYQSEINGVLYRGKIVVQ
ncbi:MAG: hypothetical protein B7C24_04150 [Bacteroidetes bacterium 4572_77]|nr:MAG: hypothetical protein B7C24_04150 [Bacteroidetes bacterium 4572_77]